MSEVVWRIHLRRKVLEPVDAAVQAFCTVRRPDTTATLFEVDGAEVDLTEQLRRDPQLRKTGLRLHYLLPREGEGRAEGPFADGAIPNVVGAKILTFDTLTGVVTVRRAR